MIFEDEQRVRKIIQEELSTFIVSDRYVFSRHAQFLDGKNIQVAKGTGTQIGTETTQKIGLWGQTPVVQPTVISDPSGGGTVDTQARTAINALIDLLQSIGGMGT